MILQRKRNCGNKLKNADAKLMPKLVMEDVLLSLQDTNRKPWNYLGAKIKDGNSSENKSEFAFSDIFLKARGP